jgi:hypothetical protein
VGNKRQQNYFTNVIHKIVLLIVVRRGPIVFDTFSFPFFSMESLEMENGPENGVSPHQR